MNITELFLQAAEKYPDHIAIQEEKRSITYAQLRDSMHKTAGYFRKKGIQKGDRVLVFIPMCIDLYRTVLALFHIGAVAVFLDEWVSRKRLELCCDLADCTGFIGIRKARIYSIFSPALRRIPVKLSMNTQMETLFPSAPIEENDPALITFTTGSTGTPKAALRSHGFLRQQFQALMREIQPTPYDVDMPVLPIVLFMNLGVGAVSVISPFNQKKPHAESMQKQAACLEKFSIDRITASPYFLYRLAERCLGDGRDTRGIKKIFTGGAAVFPASADLLLRGFPEADIQIVYGSTEAEPISAISAIELAKAHIEETHGLPVGRVNEHIALRIIPVMESNISNEKKELHTMFLADREIGEIIVAGPHVLAAYYKNENAFSRNKIIDADRIWHRTGDSGFTINGNLFLTGPCKQLIRRKDRYISPFITEYILSFIPGIAAGTIIEKNGRLIVFLESKHKDVVRLIPTEIPYDEVRFIHRIPRDPRHYSKIDYNKLMEML